jgi:hypothetical protein
MPIAIFWWAYQAILVDMQERCSAAKIIVVGTWRSEAYRRVPKTPMMRLLISGRKFSTENEINLKQERTRELTGLCSHVIAHRLIPLRVVVSNLTISDLLWLKI